MGAGFPLIGILNNQAFEIFINIKLTMWIDAVHGIKRFRDFYPQSLFSDWQCFGNIFHLIY